MFLLLRYLSSRNPSGRLFVVWPLTFVALAASRQSSGISSQVHTAIRIPGSFLFRWLRATLALESPVSRPW